MDNSEKLPVAPGDEYEFQNSEGNPVPDVPEGVGTVTIHGPTIALTHNPGLTIGDVLELTQAEHGIEGTFRIDNITANVEVEPTTPEGFWKRWRREWLKDITLDVVTITGRRLWSKTHGALVREGKHKLPFVRGCGHKLDLYRQPRHRNCSACWTSFFRNQEEMSEGIAKALAEHGPKAVIQVHGKKFLTEFQQYAILVSRVEALRKALEEQDNVRESIASDAEASIEVG